MIGWRRNLGETSVTKSAMPMLTGTEMRSAMTPTRKVP
jgi:hypothetical protein